LPQAAPQRRDRRLDRLEGIAERRQQRDSLIGQRRQAAGARDQRDAQLRLEIGDAMREGGTGNAERGGGGALTAMARQSGERGEAAQRWRLLGYCPVPPENDTLW
jgi:hypothetical protein